MAKNPRFDEENPRRMSSAPQYAGPVPVEVRVGKTDASHSKGANGTVSVYEGQTKGSESDTTTNVTAYNRFADLDASKWVLIMRFPPSGKWEIFAGEC